MTGMLLLSCLALLGASALGKEIEVVNKCGFTVWVGTQGNEGKQHLESGGFQLNAGESKTLGTEEDHGGRIWGRTECNFDGAGNGPCATGDCGNKLQCAGAGGVPPVSLAEWTFKGKDDGQDYYDVSFVDGFNLPISFGPADKTHNDGDAQYRCLTTTCTQDLNANCYEELKVKAEDGHVVACNSACNKYNTPEYCCTGDHDKLETCKSSDWPVNYPKYFKDACPDAYSYAFDDNKSLDNCDDAKYRVTFCP